ncbi:MAG: hypothetical protein V1740_03595 [Candidatus Woesearchaeota archaeon]
MKIMILSSMTFAKGMLETKKKLEENNHEVYLSQDAELYRDKPELKNDYDQELKHSSELDSLREGFDKVEKSDAVLVLNYGKNGIKGYIGASVLMELGAAYFLNKKIFLLNPVDKSQKCALEIDMIKPIILNGNIEELK